MDDVSDATYHEKSYDSGLIGYGDKPGIVVVDFQTAFTEAQYPLGGSSLIDRAVDNSARLLEVARRCEIPVANCYTAYKSADDMPYWKVKAVRDDLIHGHPSTELDDRIYDPDYDVKICKTGPSIFFQTAVVPFFVRQKIDTVIVLGCVTSGCVRASVIDSFQFGYRTIVPEDGVGDHDERPHHDNLRDVGRRYADITDTDSVIEWIEAWRGRNQA